MYSSILFLKYTLKKSRRTEFTNEVSKILSTNNSVEFASFLKKIVDAALTRFSEDSIHLENNIDKLYFFDKKRLELPSIDIQNKQGLNNPFIYPFVKSRFLDKGK